MLHCNAIRIMAVIMLAATCLFSFGHIYYTNSKPITPDIFILIQGCMFIYLFLAMLISHLIKNIINKGSQSLNGILLQPINIIIHHIMQTNARKLIIYIGSLILLIIITATRCLDFFYFFNDDNRRYTWNIFRQRILSRYNLQV